MNEAQLYRNLADAIDRLERVKKWAAFDGSAPPEGDLYGLKLEWTLDAFVPGYREIRQSVQAQIETMLPRLVLQAVQEAVEGVERAREALRKEGAAC